MIKKDCIQFSVQSIPEILFSLETLNHNSHYKLYWFANDHERASEACNENKNVLIEEIK